MHVLMALWDGAGTVPVEVGVARRLAAAGHRVTVLAEPSMESVVTAAGARFRTWEQAPHPVQANLADWECATPFSLFPRLLERLATGPSALFAADVRAVAAEEAVDAAVVDAALLGALVGTESLGIPTAVCVPGPSVRPTPGEPPFGSGLSPGRSAAGRLRDQVVPRLLERLWDLGLRDLNATRQGLGPKPVGHVWRQLDRVDRVLLLTAESFDFPAGQRPANVRYVGPVLDDPAWAGVGVDPPAGEAPLVLVGLSTSRTRGAAGLLARVVRALDAAPVRAVVTTGPALPPIPSPRPGIRVVPSAAHSRLMKEASAVITHGGHGTVIKALAEKRPLLVLPLGRDQPDNAARVVWHHAGLRLPSRAEPERITRAVSELVRDPSYAAAAGELGRRIRAEAGRGRIVAEIEGMVAARR